jgi:hypothetical protein
MFNFVSTMSMRDARLVGRLYLCLHRTLLPVVCSVTYSGSEGSHLEIVLTLSVSIFLRFVSDMYFKGPNVC